MSLRLSPPKRTCPTAYDVDQGIPWSEADPPDFRQYRRLKTIPNFFFPDFLLGADMGSLPHVLARQTAPSSIGLAENPFRFNSCLMGPKITPPMLLPRFTEPGGGYPSHIHTPPAPA